MNKGFTIDVEHAHPAQFEDIDSKSAAAVLSLRRARHSVRHRKLFLENAATHNTVAGLFASYLGLANLIAWRPGKPIHN